MGPQCKVCLTPRARSLPRDLLIGHRFRCRSALDLKSLPQAGRNVNSLSSDWVVAVHVLYPVSYRGSSFGAVLHPVIVVVLKLLLVDRCRTRMSSIFGQWGSLGSFGWVLRAFYSYYAPQISPTQVDAVGCKVSGPTVRMSVDSTVFLCECAP